MKATTKRFTKGQHVTVLVNWDRKGTVAYYHAAVHSCGAKRMVLYSSVTGDEIGREFSPDNPYIVPRLTDAALTQFGLATAETFLREEREHLNRCLNNTTAGEGYLRAIRADLAKLHEPRVIPYPNR